jgi:hypothetical protein
MFVYLDPEQAPQVKENPNVLTQLDVLRVSFLPLAPGPRQLLHSTTCY